MYYDKCVQMYICYMYLLSIYFFLALTEIRTRIQKPCTSEQMASRVSEIFDEWQFSHSSPVFAPHCFYFALSNAMCTVTHLLFTCTIALSHCCCCLLLYIDFTLLFFSPQYLLFSVYSTVLCSSYPTLWRITNQFHNSEMTIRWLDRIWQYLKRLITNHTTAMSQNEKATFITFSLQDPFLSSTGLVPFHRSLSILISPVQICRGNQFP